MSTIKSISVSEVDRAALLPVEESMTPGSDIVIGALGPVRTGFGTRLLVPLGDAQIEQGGDPGCFLELTYEQALDLNAKLAQKLNELARKR